MLLSFSEASLEHLSNDLTGLVNNSNDLESLQKIKEILTKSLTLTEEKINEINISKDNKSKSDDSEKESNMEAIDALDPKKTSSSDKEV
jgi:hypothetical protein